MNNLSIYELMATSGLVTLIWIIQILQYPGFLLISSSDFHNFHKFHMSRISYIVIPLMFAEVYFLVANFRMLPSVLVILVWLSTFLIQVPCHNRLALNYTVKDVQRLISTNWIRTILWSMKLIILILG
jgi:hypothetical protein